ncbi:MAG: hypothetical protein QOH06_3834 [Acidobacteriota bacterium]|jgi:hypothetical protein|nr:hypothetical protein [Acidobacteriota bacterium]
MIKIHDPFGHTASEAELNLPSSDYARLFFVEVPFLKIALQAESYLFVGRRGSGKTALAQYFSFQDRQLNAIVIQLHQPTAYLGEILAIAEIISDHQLLKVSRLQEIWEYTLWRVIFERVRDGSGDAATTCEGTTVAPDTDSKLAGSVLKVLAAKLNDAGSRSSTESISGALFDGPFELERQKILDMVERPIIIVIDTLEHYDKNNETLMTSMAALLQCAADFNLRYSKRGKHIKLFMSGELFPHLVEEVVSNPTKTVRDPVFLHWQPSDLLRLICWRLYNFLQTHFPGQLKASVSEINWDDPVDVTEKVWRPCFGWEVTNPQGIQERTFSYILRHTQMRPRQLIYLCNQIANISIRKGTFPRISEEDIRLGVEEGQEALAQEILNSYSGVYPQVPRISDALSGMPMVFGGNDLDKIAKQSAWAWPAGTYSSNNFRRLVAEIGVVGRVREQSEVDRYIGVEFEYLQKDRLYLSHKDKCAIHPMFYRRLNVHADMAFRVTSLAADEERAMEVGSHRYRREVQIFLYLSRRAESADRSKLVDTFVNVGPLMNLLSTRDHQIVFGRRGTGKTHALLYLDSVTRARGDFSAYIDLRTIGSTFGIYSSQAVTVTERATRLLMDTLGAVHESLREQIIVSPVLGLESIAPLLDELAEAITEVMVTGSVQTEQSISAGETRSSRGSIDLSLGQAISAKFGKEFARSSTDQEEAKVVRSGVAQHRVHFGQVGNTLREIMKAIAPRRLWILLDEWSVVPAELQPLLADLIRRSLFPLAGISVKIASIEQRSHFQVPTAGGDYIGIEVGADASADVNLDDFMVYENSPKRATKFFLELIFRHVKAIQEEVSLTEARFQDSSEVLRAFTQRSTFEELVRAAEGVPRDAINILSMAAQRALDEPIAIDDVRTAAKSWYQRDKRAVVAANPGAKALLNWIIDEVIGQRRTRGFLLQSDERHDLIDALFDARVLHLLRRDIAAPDQPGARYDAYKIDYGCYVDLLKSPRGPRGLFSDAEAEAEGEDKYLDVAPDDDRSIRRAILDLRAFQNAVSLSEPGLKRPEERRDGKEDK